MRTTTRKTRSQEERLVLKLCRAFLEAPTARGTLESLCASLVTYEFDARFKAVSLADDATAGQRAEVKELVICRSCRVKLDGSNRSGVSGYQCINCKKQYHREYMAQQRAGKTAALKT